MRLHYKGTADERAFLKADFARHGIDQEAVKFNADNGFMEEIGEKAGQWLLDNDTDFEQAESKPSPRAAGSPSESK